MSDRRPKGELVLCIYPSAKGFGFAVFEGSHSLVDWGVKGVHGERKNAQSLRKIRGLLAFYRPDSSLPRTTRARARGGEAGSKQLIDAIGALAAKESVASSDFSRDRGTQLFRLERKAADRGAIAQEFPELEPRLPPVRRIWMSEDARMNMFDAVALGMTFFHTKEKKRAA